MIARAFLAVELGARPGGGGGGIGMGVPLIKPLINFQDRRCPGIDDFPE